MSVRPARLRPLALLLVLLSSLLACTATQAQELVGVYLTWKQDPTTTMTINWVDLYATGGKTLWHREKGGEDWTSATAAESKVADTVMLLRRVELTKLKPDTMYEFVIAQQVDSKSSVMRFRTMPDKFTRNIRFVSGGDMMHTRASVDAMNAQAARLDPDFALLGGDLAYANGVSVTRWIDWLQSWWKVSVGKDRRLIPMVLAIGNHEVRSGTSGKPPQLRAPFFYSLFDLPEGRSYYALDFADYLSFIILDTNHTQPIDGAQTQWLGEALSQRAGQTFLFPCYHYPAYGTQKAPSGKTPLDATTAIAVRKHWVPLFERHGITVAFENDHHTFKRSHRILDGKRDDQNGLLYLGDGAWGVKTRSVPKLPDAWWLAKAQSINHLWSVELTPKGTATIQALDVTGKVFDEVRIGEPRTKPRG